jgi:hypothetical protein
MSKCEIDVLTQKQLTKEELEASLPYACYDRTMFHYFERLHNLSKFKQLFMDRYLGFTYSELNEPILPLPENGFDSVKEKFGLSFEVYPREIPVLLEKWVKKGYMAHAMLITQRMDGSTYNTSNLIEKVEGERVFLTKTNETMTALCVPFTIEELLKKLPINEENKCEINFIKVDDKWLEKMRSVDFKHIFETVMKEEFHYCSSMGKLYHEGEEVEPHLEAFWMLAEYFLNSKKEILKNGIDKRNQLRMYKHIANKIEPILNCWDEIAIAWEESEINDIILEIRSDLKDLLKWFSLLYNRTNDVFYDKYVASLQELIGYYSIFQTKVHQFVVENMEVKYD